jgi:hypothetical protein
MFGVHSSRKVSQCSCIKRRLKNEFRAEDRHGSLERERREREKREEGQREREREREREI